MFNKGNKLVFFVLLGVLFSLCGCARVKEGTRGFLGVSTKVLEENRNTAVSKTFNYSYADCFEKTKTVLLDKGSYIYAGSFEKRMLAVYVSVEDTTPVGVFFKEIDATKTQIEVSSPSIYAKEKIFKRILVRIEGLDDPEEEKENPEGQEKDNSGEKAKLP